MNEPFTGQFDPRSTDDLINAALGDLDEDKAWEAIAALHFRGTAEVLRRARALCESE
jgi:hypothetical protein